MTKFLLGGTGVQSTHAYSLTSRRTNLHQPIYSLPSIEVARVSNVVGPNTCPMNSASVCALSASFSNSRVCASWPECACSVCTPTSGQDQIHSKVSAESQVSDSAIDSMFASANSHAQCEARHLFTHWSVASEGARQQTTIENAHGGLYPMCKKRIWMWGQKGLQVGQGWAGTVRCHTMQAPSCPPLRQRI